MSSSSSLAAANQACHARFDALIVDALVALTALDFARAEAVWSELGLLLAGHQVVEESLLAALPIGTAAPRGGAPSLVLAEHARLKELHEAARLTVKRLSEVSNLPEPDRRRAMVNALDDLLRVRHLLDHHGEREQTIVYPHLAASFEVARCESVATLLRSALGS